MKIGRNSSCPCGSGIKYKHCCLKKGIQFDRMSKNQLIRNLCIRGKNLHFLYEIASILQLDKIAGMNNSFWPFVNSLKKAITPTAVRDIHQAIIELWPDGVDLNRCLQHEKDTYSGLFLGSYLLDVTVRLLNRHAMYNQTIILIDPFMDPRITAPKFNPIENPEQHITTTFHYIFLWLQLAPWIEAGIVKIIRDPSDFDLNLKRETFDLSRQKVEDYPELDKILKSEAKLPELEKSFKDIFTFAHPDEFWIEKIGKNNDLSKEEILSFLKHKREHSLYHVNSNFKSQLLQWTSGVNYEMGKHICDITNSHIITDLNYRFEEIKHDRKINNIEINEWSTFAKAFQESNIKHLDGLFFKDLLRLRNDGYLERMRAFLRRTWSASSSGEAFSNNDVENLSAELIGEIDLAETEWSKIDSNLLKWFGSESIIGTSIGLATGVANWVPAVVIAGVGAFNLVQAKYERKNFLKKYPAGFFIDEIRKET